MPRWKDLPDEVEPEIKEFVQRLRELVDSGGPNGPDVASVAERTGYSRTSWEGYLGGRLLAPKGAVVALAEVTDTDPVRLTRLWERAERAWSRAESEQDMAAEAVRLTRTSAGGPSPSPSPSPQSAPPAAPSVPARPTVPDAPEVALLPQRKWGGGVEGHAKSRDAQGSSRDARNSPSERASSTRATSGRRRLPMLLAGLAGAAALIAVVLHFTGGDGANGGRDNGRSAAGPANSMSPGDGSEAGLVAEVGCTGVGCTGKDPEAMGCGQPNASTVTDVTVGTTLLELRYSDACQAVWGRIIRSVPGDQVRIITTAGERTATAGTEAYVFTPMLAVTSASEARACVTLRDGRAGCTR